MEPPAGPPPIIATSKSGFVRTNVLLLKIFNRWGAVKIGRGGKPAHAAFRYHDFAGRPCQGDLLLHLASIFSNASPELRVAYKGQTKGIPRVRITFANFSLQRNR